MSRLPNGFETKNLSVRSLLFFVLVRSTATSPTPKKGGKYNQYRKGFLPSPHLPNSEVPHNEIYTEDHLFDLSRFVLVAIKTIDVSKNLYANYQKTEFVSSFQL